MTETITRRTVEATHFTDVWQDDKYRDQHCTEYCTGYTIRTNGVTLCVQSTVRRATDFDGSRIDFTDYRATGFDGVAAKALFRACETVCRLRTSREYKKHLSDLERGVHDRIQCDRENAADALLTGLSDIYQLHPTVIRDICETAVRLLNSTPG